MTRLVVRVEGKTYEGRGTAPNRDGDRSFVVTGPLEYRARARSRARWSGMTAEWEGGPQGRNPDSERSRNFWAAARKLHDLWWGD